VFGGKKQNPYEAKTGRQLGTSAPLEERKKINDGPKPFETTKRLTGEEPEPKRKKQAVNHTQVDAAGGAEKREPIGHTRVDEEEG